MEQILIVFTGGTISCRAGAAVMGATADAPYLLLRRYREEREETVDFTTASPLTILSENLLPDDWKTIADCVRKRLTPDMAGVVITHGTDTLAYSAAALSFMLAGIGVPVALVAANYPPDDPRSNGCANFSSAVDFILNERLPGVYVFFRQQEADCVFLGSRVTQALPLSGTFASVTGRPWGWMEEGRLRLTGGPHEPMPEEIMAQPAETPPVFPPLRSCVQFLRPYPGMDYRRLSLHGSVRAVFHGLYHSGTACVRQAEQGGDTDFSAFVRRCAAEGLPVYLSPIWQEDVLYASAKRIRECGARLLPPMAEEAAYCKLLLAYSLYPENEEARTAYLSRNLAFEHIW